MARSQSILFFAAAILLLCFATSFSPVYGFLTFLKSKSGEPAVTLTKGASGLNMDITQIPNVTKCENAQLVATLLLPEGARFSACAEANKKTCDITNNTGNSTMQLLFKTKDATTLGTTHITDLKVTLDVVIPPTLGTPGYLLTSIENSVAMGNIACLVADETYLITAKYQLGTQTFSNDVYANVKLTVTGSSGNNESVNVLCYTTDVIIRGDSSNIYG